MSDWTEAFDRFIAHVLWLRICANGEDQTARIVHQRGYSQPPTGTECALWSRGLVFGLSLRSYFLDPHRSDVTNQRLSSPVLHPRAWRL